MYTKLCQYIPAGVNSPANAWKSMGCNPIVVKEAQGDTLVSTEGNRYIDYCLSWGALPHGHAHPAITAAVTEQLPKGTTYGLSGESVLPLAEAIVQAVPSIEMVRFVSSGTEATMAAVRLARGFTRRKYIVKFEGNYHGHADQFLVKAGSAVAELPEASSIGIPDDAVKHTLSVPYNDTEACRTLLNNPQFSQDIAAVIVEPIAGNIGVVPGKIEFLKMLRKETQKIGALLIFDEVISGFRVGPQGAQGLYGIDPDITCLGKIIGGGFPAAAFGGSSEIMNHIAPLGDIFQAGTLSGNPVAMVAGYTAIKMAMRDGFYEEMEMKANRVTKPVQAYIAEKNLNAVVQQRGSMFTLFLGARGVSNFEEVNQCNPELFRNLFLHMLERGIYIPPSQHEAWFVSSAHTNEHLDMTSEAVVDFLKML